MVPEDAAARDRKFLQKKFAELDKRCSMQGERIVVLEKQLENEVE